MVGDVIGRPGRAAFAKYTPKLRREKNADLVVVNGENSADGRGITKKTLDELLLGGADVVTSGNHVWDKKETAQFIDDERVQANRAKRSEQWEKFTKYLESKGKLRK